MKFINPHLVREKRTLFDAVLWKLGFYADPIRLSPPPEEFAFPANPPPFDPAHPSAVWIGHSTYLIQEKTCAFLTDPVWSHHCAPVKMKAFQRIQAPALPLDALPPLTAVLLSHNHYDHLDATVARHLKDTLWIVPERLGAWFRQRRIPYRELRWGESTTLNGCTITAVPAQHFSGRSLWDRDYTHWCGYVVTFPSGKKLYFVGDTGYNPVDFKRIGDAHGPMDLSLIPIGSYSPRAFMSPVHIGPDEAVKIHQEVGSRLSLAMHWGTFRLSEEPMDRPPYDLLLALHEADLDPATFLPIAPGRFINW